MKINRRAEILSDKKVILTLQLKRETKIHVLHLAPYLTHLIQNLLIPNLILETLVIFARTGVSILSTVSRKQVPVVHW